MTFEIHHQKLGKIAFTPKAFITDQEPYNLRDYFKQVRRWYLGWWQTVRRHGFWPSLFAIATALFEIEMLTYATFFLSIPITITWLTLYTEQPLPRLFDLFIAVFVVDYLLTILISLIERKPVLIIYGFAFSLLRYIDAFIFLTTLPLAVFTTSSGRWVSPARRA